MAIVLSKEKIFIKQDAKEIIRLAFYVDKEEINEITKQYGIVINNETDLENFLQGKSMIGVPHHINFYELARMINVSEEMIKISDIEFE